MVFSLPRAPARRRFAAPARGGGVKAGAVFRATAEGGLALMPPSKLARSKKPSEAHSKHYAPERDARATSCPKLGRPSSACADRSSRRSACPSGAGSRSSPASASLLRSFRRSSSRRTRPADTNSDHARPAPSARGRCWRNQRPRHQETGGRRWEGCAWCRCRYAIPRWGARGFSAARRRAAPEGDRRCGARGTSAPSPAPRRRAPGAGVRRRRGPRTWW